MHEVQFPMKNPLRKLSRTDQGGRRQAIEQEAAQQLEAASDQAPPPETAAVSWVNSSTPVPETAPSSPPGPAAVERRLTVQERMAARR